MRTTIVFVCLLFSLSLWSQTPFDTTSWWQGNQIIGLHDFEFQDSFDEITFDSLDQSYRYGYITIFYEGEFHSFNSGWCGNECRRHIKGTYKINENKITFFAETLTYTKECAHKSVEEINQSLGTYFWIRDEFGLRIMKSLDNEPKEDYFADLQIELQTFKDPKAQSFVRKYAYHYNRTIQVLKNENEEKYQRVYDEFRNWSYLALLHTHELDESEKAAYQTLIEKFSSISNQLFKEVFNKIRS